MNKIACMQVEAFKEVEGTDFQIAFSDDYHQNAKLVEVKILGQARKSGVQPFSLLFETIGEDKFYDQGTYPVKHPSMLPLDLFLVPLGPGEKERSMIYEAVIN